MLFKKAAIFGDIHHGKKNNSEIHNKDCSDYIDWFISKVKEHHCDTIIMLGDYYEYGKSINSLTQNYAYNNAKKLSDIGIPVYFLIGNHDLYYLEKRTVHNLPWIGHLPNIIEINEVTLIDDCLFCPWLVSDEYSLVLNTPSKYVFGHFELPLFLMNRMIEAPDKGGLHLDHFKLCEEVYSGHFHMRQQKINTHGVYVSYIGNTFPMNFNDANDFNRGMAILPHGRPAQYINWTECPTYERIKLSTLLGMLEKDDTTFNPKATIECANDIDMSVDDCLIIKDAMQNMVRHFYLDPQKVVEQEQELIGVDDTDTVQDIVVSLIENMDLGKKYQKQLLIDLFNKAGERK